MKKPQPKSKPKPTDMAGRIGAVTAVLVAVGALIAAAKPIYEFAAPLTCRALPTWCETQPDTNESSNIAAGTVGWIYVGTRVDGNWKVTQREGNEPALTLQTTDVPSENKTYYVDKSVHIRDKSPESQSDGSRPTMSSSKGVIGPRSQVKVDKIVTYDLKNPTATWVFAHVTLLSKGRD